MQPVDSSHSGKLSTSEKQVIAGAAIYFISTVALGVLAYLKSSGALSHILNKVSRIG